MNDTPATTSIYLHIDQANANRKEEDILGAVDISLEIQFYGSKLLCASWTAAEVSVWVVRP